MTPDIERAKRYVYGRLERELSPNLTYHSLHHTRDDVLPASIRLAQASNLSGADLLLLTTAALYHDTGFLVTYQNHEQHSIAMAQESLPYFDYNAAQIDAIVEIIAATMMPQNPKTFLQQLMCDADLDLLGREDFWSLNRVLLEEQRYFGGEPISEREWLAGQTLFLENHRFFTPAARFLRNQGKAINLDRMRASLASFNGAAPQAR